jgi:hypothetical protein
MSVVERAIRRFERLCLAALLLGLSACNGCDPTPAPTCPAAVPLDNFADRPCPIGQGHRDPRAFLRASLSDAPGNLMGRAASSPNPPETAGRRKFLLRWALALGSRGRLLGRWAAV